MAPDPKKIKVAIEDLARAGKAWQDQADPLQGAANATTGRINLTPAEMGLAAPLYGAYHGICTGLYTLLFEAAGQATAIGGALAHAAAVYQAEEDDGTHRIKGVW